MPINLTNCVYSFENVNSLIASKIGSKAANLAKLKNAGFPVPPGYCITEDAYVDFIKNNKISDKLIDEIKKLKSSLGGAIAIRSSANCEDGAELSMAGVFESKYVYADEDIPGAIERIYLQAQSQDVERFMALHGKPHADIRMGLIIQQLIEPDASGVIYTNVNGCCSLIQYIKGFGASLADGIAHGAAILAAPDGSVEQSVGWLLPANIIKALLYHSNKIEALFPGASQDIEFAYKKNNIYILQARPLTTDLGTVDLQETPDECLEATKNKIRELIAKEKLEMGTPTAIFSDANYSELLPRPTAMDIGLYTYIFTGSDGIPGATQRARSEMGYQNENEAIGIITCIGGRTYFSVARNAALYHIGFPETKQEYFSTLVTEYLKSVEEDPVKGGYPQMGLYLQDPTLEELQNRYGERAEEYFDVYRKFSNKMGAFADAFIHHFNEVERSNISEYIQRIDSKNIEQYSAEALTSECLEIMEHLRTITCVCFVKAARLGFYYSQRLSTLLQQHCGMTKDKSIEMFSRLTQGLDGSAITEANIAIVMAKTEIGASKVARDLIGHYSTGEMLEIRHTRLMDDPGALLAYVKGIRQSGNYIENFENQKSERIKTQESILNSLSEPHRSELTHVINSAQTYMALRETAKYLVVKEYSLIKNRLESLEKTLNLGKGDIYFFFPRELSELAASPKSLKHLVRSRRQSFDNHTCFEMPSIIRELDIDSICLKRDNDEEFGEATGRFLAEGPKHEGVIVNVDQCKTLDEVSITISYYRNKNIPVIIAATQLNLSHDPVIALASGLVIENAGIVSHGAQRARELGKGAIGGIKSARLKTGTRVIFDPSSRSLQRVH
jgi:phosphohistidine swiveling domain-containing protein